MFVNFPLLMLDYQRLLRLKCSGFPPPLFPAVKNPLHPFFEVQCLDDFKVIDATWTVSKDQMTSSVLKFEIQNSCFFCWKLYI